MRTVSVNNCYTLTVSSVKLTEKKTESDHQIQQAHWPATKICKPSHNPISHLTISSLMIYIFLNSEHQIQQFHSP